MWPYLRPPKAGDRFRSVATRNPTTSRSDSATRQRRSFGPMCSLMNSRPSEDAFDGRTSCSPRSRWYARRSLQRPATTSTSSSSAARMRTSPAVGGPLTGLEPRGGVSLPLEDRLALLEERLEPLLRVRHREQTVLEFPLEGEALLDRHLHPLDDGPLDQAHGAARVLRVREPLRVLHHFVHEDVRVPNAVHEPPLERLVRREGPARHHHVDRLRFPDETRQPLAPARPGEDAER